MLHGAAVQDADRDAGVDSGYDLAALFLMDPPKPEAPAACSPKRWPGEVDVRGGAGDGCGCSGAGDGGDGGDGGDAIGRIVDVTASLVATSAVPDVVSSLLPASPPVATGELVGRGLPAEAADRVLLVRGAPPVSSSKQCRGPPLPSAPRSAHPPDATVRLLSPPVADVAVADPVVSSGAAIPPYPSGLPPQDEPGSVVERAAIRSAAGRARSLRTRRRNALRVSNMMQAIEYLEVANGRLRIAVTSAVAAAGSSREAGERARVVAGLRDALGSSTGAGVMLFLHGLLLGLDGQGG